MINVEEAKARILLGMEPLGSETVSLANGFGRVLAHDLVARRAQPPADVSAMDGYAVHGSDISQLPTTLRLTGEAAAGSMPLTSLEPRSAVRIFTGGPLPRGADTVVIQENINVIGTDRIEVLEGVPGANVRKRGIDFNVGDKCLSKGQTLTARDISLAASLNVPWLTVYRKPRVAILATGDELVLPGENPSEAGIVASTSFGLAAYVEQWGGVPINLGIARDSRESLSQYLSACSDFDILITLGGASVGDYDLVQESLSELGMKLDFWKIAMRPGKPLMFGHLDHKPVLGLPGNPVSAFVCALLFLAPLIKTATCSSQIANKSVPQRLPLAVSLPANGKRQDYMRAKVAQDSGGTISVRPFDVQDSSLMTVFAECDCLVIRPPHAPPAQVGDFVEVLWA